ncbi:hypothetical protein Tco_0001009, partial [Tanacetum coccineum]
KDAKIIEESKVDKEMADATQANAEKIDKEKEKPDVPRSSSSLSISSDYGTQFLNLPFDFTLIGITKEFAYTEINSMLDIQIQQKITTLQSPILLVVPVSVIPEQSIPTPTPAQQVPIVTSSTLIIQQSTQIPTPPTTSLTLTITTIVHAPLPVVIQRLLDIERCLEDSENQARALMISNNVYFISSFIPCY